MLKCHLFFSKDPTLHLNYAIFLYNNGDRKSASKQFNLFEEKLKLRREDVDAEVCGSLHCINVIICTAILQEAKLTLILEG